MAEKAKTRRGRRFLSDSKENLASISWYVKTYSVKERNDEGDSVNRNYVSAEVRIYDGYGNTVEFSDYTMGAEDRERFLNELDVAIAELQKVYELVEYVEVSS